MITRRTIRLLITITVLVSLAIPTFTVLAEGTETLGPPEITISPGSGHVAAGTGLINQPGTIDITVPAGANVEQVLLYWEGHGNCGIMPQPCELGKDLTINGNQITGTLIGGPTFFYTLPPNMFSLSYRADITGLGIVNAGPNTLTISGVSFDASSPTWGDDPGFANGASVVVIYDDGTFADVDIRDGNDNAYFAFDPPLDTTVPQTFEFAAEGADRVADLTLLVGSVESPEFAPPGPRATRVVVTSGGITSYVDNALISSDGETWDTLTINPTIPAGATSLTVQILSEDALDIGALPASLSWVNATLSVPITPTNGAGVGTPGYWKNHSDAWPVEEIVIGGITYTKSQALEIMNTSPRGDMSYQMFWHLVAAKLNVANGADSSCIADTIAAADDWMATYGPAGSNVRANNGAWDIGEPIKNTLDQYNNGKLCAPPRD